MELIAAEISALKKLPDIINLEIIDGE